MRTEITIEGIKYTWAMEDGRFSCLRNGQRWLDSDLVPSAGSRAIIALILQLAAARDEIEQWRGKLAEQCGQTLASRSINIELRALLVLALVLAGDDESWATWAAMVRTKLELFGMTAPDATEPK